MSTRLRIALVALFLCLTLGIHLSVGNSASAKTPIDFSDQGPGFSTPPISCKDYKDDRAYLLDVNVNISPGPNGPTVRVTQASDGTVLREIYPDEKFYKDGGSQLNVQYQIVPQCGGFDVVYTLTNAPGNPPQNMPELRVDGIKQAVTGDVYLLKTKDYGYVQQQVLPPFPSNSSPAFQIGPYPNMTYAPVIVMHDKLIAVGSSLQYPYINPGYHKTVTPRLERQDSGALANSWSHRYYGFLEDSGTSPQATVAPGQTMQSTVSTRFSSAHNWLLTLFPYKQYFLGLYGAHADIQPRDRTPVFAISAADALLSTSMPCDTCPPPFNSWPPNPRGYTQFGYPNWQKRLDIDGWGPDWTNEVITGNEHPAGGMKGLGYHRNMIWNMTGIYGPPSEPAYNLNFPPQFVSDWLPVLDQTKGYLADFNSNGISMGCWWGHAASIPVPIQWNPKTLKEADFDTLADTAFLDNELALAQQLGCKEIGLDAFVSKPTYKRYERIDVMKKLTSHQIKFIHEGAGPDFMNSKIPNFYFPQAWNWWGSVPPHSYIPMAPDVLTAYLNPGTPGNVDSRPEIWVQFLPPFGGATTVQNLVQWGFTPLGGWALNISTLDSTLVACSDGLDNDGDGKIDWPYAPGCATAAGTSESAPPPADTIPPTVSISAPTTGAVLSGLVTVSAQAADNGGVASVQLFVDGNPAPAGYALVPSTTLTYPYRYLIPWDTAATTPAGQPLFPNGPHTLTVMAWDTAIPYENHSLSLPVTVSVQNPHVITGIATSPVLATSATIK